MLWSVGHASIQNISMQQWALIRTTHAQHREQNMLAVIHTCCKKSRQLQWLWVFKMGTRCSRLLRKERVVVLGKLDCWIEQARSRLCHAGGRTASKNGCSGQDSNATGCDITILVATVRVVSRTGSLASAHVRYHCHLGQLHRRWTRR